MQGLVLDGPDTDGSRLAGYGGPVTRERGGVNRAQAAYFAIELTRL